MVIIFSLCIADCLFCMVVLPFNVFRFIHGTWTHGDLLCRLIPFLQYGNIGVSLLCIAMITINRYESKRVGKTTFTTIFFPYSSKMTVILNYRYIMITHNTSYAQIYKKHWIATMIVFCWLVAYGMQLPTFFGVWGKFNCYQNIQMK